MAERFQTLKRSEASLVMAGCPVMIEAYALLKDAKTNKTLAQLKMRNLSEKTIIAAKVSIEALEISGTLLEGVENYSFLDLDIKQGDVFGDRNPIYLPDLATRNIHPCVTEIVFDDHSLWQGEASSWETLEKPESLPFTDQEMLIQYQMETKGKVKNRPAVTKGFFICSCGTINLEGTPCYSCGRTAEELLLPLKDVEALELRCQERVRETEYNACLSIEEKENVSPEELLDIKERYEKLGDYKDSQERSVNCAQKAEDLLEEARKKKEEEEKRQEEERKRLEEEKQRKLEKRKRTKKRIVILIFSVLLLATLTYVTIRHIIPAVRYSNAGKAVEAHSYDKAYKTYTALGGYKDSADLAIETLYQKGMFLKENGQYLDAAAEFEKILKYKDSMDQAMECKNQAAYLEAKALFDEGKFLEASKGFEQLGEYSDSADMHLEAIYQQGLKLLADGQYDDAHDTFDTIPRYKDSADMANESYYQKALVLYEEGEYGEAGGIFRDLKKYKDSTDYAAEATYLYAIEKAEAGEYKDAIAEFAKVINYKEALEKTWEVKYAYAGELVAAKNYKDASDYYSQLARSEYLDSAQKYKEIYYLYGIQLFNKSSFNEAAGVFKKLGDYEDCATRYLEAYYKYGLKLLNAKSYTSAITVFEELNGYEESYSKINEAKYGYVKAHKNNTDEKTYAYLKDLVSIGYGDSYDIYNSLYAWKVTLRCANSSTYDDVTIKTSVSKYVSYFHFWMELEGGTPGEKVTLTHTVIWPNGAVSYSDWYWDNMGNGYTFGAEWRNGLYPNGSGYTGTLTVRIYIQSTGQYLGEFSIKLT